MDDYLQQLVEDCLNLVVEILHPLQVDEVVFINQTQHNCLRHPRDLGLRVDKAASEVVKERYLYYFLYIDA